MAIVRERPLTAKTGSAPVLPREGEVARAIARDGGAGANVCTVSAAPSVIVLRTLTAPPIGGARDDACRFPLSATSGR
jgi:hypothetical protein